MFFRKQKALVNDNLPQLSEPTHIGPDTVIDGTISSDGEVLIDGTLRGFVKASACVVAVNGVVEGEVNADEIIILGRVYGPIHGRHVHLQAGAAVEGDITCDTIAIDNGARLSGAVWQADTREEKTKINGFAQEPSPPLFAESLKTAELDDSFRPLKAVRTRS